MLKRFTSKGATRFSFFILVHVVLPKPRSLLGDMH